MKSDPPKLSKSKNGFDTTLGMTIGQSLLKGVPVNSPKQSVRLTIASPPSLHDNILPAKRFTPYRAKGIKRDRETKAA